MPYIDNLDFLNLNSLRSYPIKEGLSRVSTNGAFTIPNDLIVDMQIAASYDPSRRFYISKISNFGDVITIQLSDNFDVVAGAFTISSYVQYKEYFFEATDEYVGATGVLVVGYLDGLTQQPDGNFFFAITTAELETRAVIPALKGINRIIFENANGKSFSLTGDIKLVARTNLRFSLTDDDTITIDAGENLGLNTVCSADEPCIKTINGIPPDEVGNFTLDFSDCATLTPIPANTGLLLQDICCKPCTGCNDIEELTNRLTSLESNLLSLKDYYTALNTFFENFKTTVTYTCDCPPE